MLIEAAYQSNFDDPHFLGGPCCFNYVKTADNVDALEMKADPVIRGFVSYIRKCAGEETLQQAEAYAAQVEAAFTWLRKTVRSP